MASYKHYPERPASTAWRVYHRGKSYWVGSESLAKAKVAELEGGKGAFSPRELDEYRHARQLLGDVPLLTAVRHYLERQSGETETTVTEAVKRHIKAQAGRPDYLEKKTYFLGKLEAVAGDVRLGAVTPDQIEKAMLGFKSDWMKNDFLKHVRILFRYCGRMRLTRNDPTAGMVERKVTASKVILTLADTAHLLDCCRTGFPAILPALALQLFMGIRTSEVGRLQWDAVKGGEFVDIAAEVAKTHERRVIDWWPKRLTQYLPPAKERGGRVVQSAASYDAAKVALVKVCRVSKPDFTWGQNAPRHSFASYAVARWQDAGRVALWMGQRDVNILFRHYRSYCTEAEGKTYFGG